MLVVDHVATFDFQQIMLNQHVKLHLYYLAKYIYKKQGSFQSTQIKRSIGTYNSCLFSSWPTMTTFRWHLNIFSSFTKVLLPWKKIKGSPKHFQLCPIFLHAIVKPWTTCAHKCHSWKHQQTWNSMYKPKLMLFNQMTKAK